MASRKGGKKSQPPSPMAGVAEAKEEEPTVDPQIVEQLQQQVLQLQQDLQDALARQQQPPAGTGQTGAPAPAPVKLALTPAQSTAGLIDYDTKAGYGLYTRATSSVYEDVKDRYDLDTVNTQNFLNKMRDRGVSSNLSVMQPPSAIDQIGIVGGSKLDFCSHHGEISAELIKEYAKTYLGQPTRAAQDDNMLLQCLKASLSEKAYGTITSDPEEYTVNGTECGLLLFKYILTESAIDTSVDPDTIRAEIASSVSKFAELNYSVRDYADWLRLKTSQLKQKGATTTDIRTHCMTALLSHPDPEMVRYVSSQRDYIRDHPKEDYSYKHLLNRVKDKEDTMNLDLKRAQIAPATRDDPLVTLQAELKEQRKVINKLTKANKNGGGGKGPGKKKGGKKGDGSRKDIKPYPKELRKKAAPADPSKPIEIEGVQYWYCTHHKKWGKHPSHECQAKDNASGSGGSNSTPKNDRAGRAVTAYQAVRTGDGK